MIMVMIGRVCNLMGELKPALMMVVVQVAYAGENVLSKMGVDDGMSLKVINAYRFIFATAFMIPLALFLERNSRPKLTWMILFQAFLCGLFGGSLSQNLYLASLSLTPTMFAPAMTNLIPAITFILAVSFRLEKLGIKTMSGMAKVIGTLMGIGDAMLLTFYKGIEINIFSTHIDFLHDHNHGVAHLLSLHADSSKRLLGCLLAIGSCFTYALWLIIQAKMSEKYPCQYSSTTLMSLMAAIQSVVFALCVETDYGQWKLGWNIRLLLVAYSGIVASGLVVTLISWCVRMKGPLFVSIFSPLSVVVVAFLGSLLLDEQLHLGDVLGALLIVCGLYSVLWAKGKEMKKTTPLLLSNEAPPESADSTQIVIDNRTSNHKNNDNIITNGEHQKSEKENQETDIILGKN